MLRHWRIGWYLSWCVLSKTVFVYQQKLYINRKYFPFPSIDIIFVFNSVAFEQVFSFNILFVNEAYIVMQYIRHWHKQILRRRFTFAIFYSTTNKFTVVATYSQYFQFKMISKRLIEIYVMVQVTKTLAMSLNLESRNIQIVL